MVITTSQCSELQNCGQISWNVKLSQLTLQSVWHWSSSHESWKLNQFTILGWTSAPTQLLPESSPLKIGIVWMLTRSPKNTWCDYCKGRWGMERRTVKIPETQQFKIVPQDAVWQITSKRHNKVIVRHYCQDCTNYVQDWHGTLWTLHEQIEYAKGVQQLNVQFE